MMILKIIELQVKLTLHNTKQKKKKLFKYQKRYTSALYYN